jgi:D-xylose transport system permease protein
LTITAETPDRRADFGIDTNRRSFSDVARDTVARYKSGDLGSLPAILAIVFLVTIFWWARPETFASAINFANFLEQASGVTVIAMAVTFVLLLGEIDLAAGFTAGISAAVLATRLQDWPLLPSILMAAAVAVVLGMFTGFMVARVGIPSFVVTLANFLSFQGILLLLVKEGGSIRITNPAIRELVGGQLTPAWSWVFTIVALVAYAVVLVQRQRSSHGSIPAGLTALKFGAAAVGMCAMTIVLNKNRAFANATKEIKGMPYLVPIIVVIALALTFLLNRTRYGRHLYAVGGNAEAARRAGINVTRVRLLAFTITGFVAAIGGAFLASRVNAVDANTGANDTLLLAVGAAVIGGTSLFGGRGRIVNAVLGGFVLALIPNGLGLIGKETVFGREIDFSSSGVKFICAGVALLLAASVDALSRKRSV